MREIKFKGRREFDRKWVYGFYANWNGESVIYDWKTRHVYRVIPETVAQYIGCKTQYGKEIYDGGKIKIYIEMIDEAGMDISGTKYYEVKWENGFWCWILDNGEMIRGRIIE